VRTGAGWRLDGEKWFVTYGDIAAVYIVMALAEGAPTLFLVEAGLPGIAVVDDPPFTHNYPHGHPTIRFTGVEVGEDAVIGGVGGGDDLQRAWFAEERLGIAARGCGAMWRLLEETTAWAISREQGGARIIDHQGVSFPLADSAADAAAGRLLGLEVARLADSGADPKLIHAKASMAKLFVSEAANRCADRCVQIFGGRGYTRVNVAERFWRELRVDRIWEGTSEIQRLIVARALERRGVERVLR
jgi:alkylation response protein AidB-like acyl-CoA dehydrogenase